MKSDLKKIIQRIKNWWNYSDDNQEFAMSISINLIIGIVLVLFLLLI